MNIAVLTSYPANILIDMSLRNSLRIKIDYEGMDKEKVDKALQPGYDSLNPDEKVIYDLVYRKGLQPTQAAGVINWGRYSEYAINVIIPRICKKMVDNTGDMLDCFMYRRRYEPVSINDCIDKPMPYPLGILQAIDIDPAFLIEDEIYRPITADQMIGLNKYLNSLDAVTQKYLKLHFYYGFGIEEISRATDDSDVNRVRRELYNAIEIARSAIINKRVIMYGYDLWLGMRSNGSGLTEEEKDQYKYILDIYLFNKRTRFALKSAVGEDKFPSVANIREAVSVPYWWKPINGIGKGFAIQAMNALKELDIIDDDNPGWDGLTRKGSGKPKKATNPEPAEVKISVHAQRVIALLDQGDKYLSNYIDDISDKERIMLKERLLLLEKVLEGGKKDE